MSSSTSSRINRRQLARAAAPLVTAGVLAAGSGSAMAQGKKEARGISYTVNDIFAFRDF